MHSPNRMTVRLPAQELHLTGCAVRVKDSFAVIVAEGGPKALKKFDKLMLKRIKWHITVEGEKARAAGEDVDEDQPDEEEGSMHASRCWCACHN